MERHNDSRRKGVVLLLILGLMAMFALSVLSYMIITSNMAETAQNYAKSNANLETPVSEDVDRALKTLLIGSDNQSNPIAPFSILENMYGDWKYYDQDTSEEDSIADFDAYLSFFPDSGIATVTPCTDSYGNWLITNDDDGHSGNWAGFRSIFDESGSVLTFLGFDNDAEENLTLDEVTNTKWDDIVKNSSAYVLERVVTNPVKAIGAGDWGPKYKNVSREEEGAFWADHSAKYPSYNGNRADYWHLDFWHFQVELTDELKRFIDSIDALEGEGFNVDGFNEKHYLVKIRMNHPAFSGTGAGGFLPGEIKDAQITKDLASAVNFDNWGSADQLQIPFAFWANAAAPDLERNGIERFGFRNYWYHLIGGQYDSNSSLGKGSGWIDPSAFSSLQLNAPYTAVDNRSLFLARYDRAFIIDANGALVDENGNLQNTSRDDLSFIIPSFHRPSLFKTLVGNSYLSAYDSIYKSGGGYDSESCLTALLRKLTPRPLPLDHYKFDGGNYVLNRDNSNKTAEGLANNLAYSQQWDVDNDGDGIREGVWVPSGLPIRVDENGTPYATMFSYTVLDLDGRVNINTAGNWDQLPNKLMSFNRRDMGNEVSEPYYFFDELNDIATSNGAIKDSSIDRNVDLLDEDGNTGAGDWRSEAFGWLDDSNNPTDVAQRGTGFGASDILLFEYLCNVWGSKSTEDVERIAENLLWRRNLSARDNPEGALNNADLMKSYRASAQPGYWENNRQCDDSLGNKNYFFQFMNPGAYVDANGKVDGSLAESFIPWRGKTSVLRYNYDARGVPFDFADTVARTYDPLGHQIYTYALQYSDNPYYQTYNTLSWEDSPYALPTLEKILRSTDIDSAVLPNQLASDLDVEQGSLNDQNLDWARAKLRTSMTTISADVDFPSQVFPNEKAYGKALFNNDPDGVYGLKGVLRKCVYNELIDLFKEKGYWVDGDPENNVDGDGYNDNFLTASNEDNIIVYAFEEKVDEITDYLWALFPPEVVAGGKFDLNALAQKNYWADAEYDDNGNIVINEDLHNIGLVKRMERARGLYLLVMTLINSNMKADNYIEKAIDSDLDKLFDAGKKDVKNKVARELMATRVAQWCVNVVDFSDPDATMTPFFFDPTPFDGWWAKNDEWLNYSTTIHTQSGDEQQIWWEYYTNTPASGNEGMADDVPDVEFLFSTVNAGSSGVPSERMAEFFLDALDNCVDLSTSAPSPYVDNNGNAVHRQTVTTVGAQTTLADGKAMRSEELIAQWMLSNALLQEENEKVKGWYYKDEDKTDNLYSKEGCGKDLGFRLAWGMERPDLLLTETLSFHDLGIADTDKETVFELGNEDGADYRDPEGDDDFDQVKRPQGSTYLEFYCTANPNVPQSPELYEFENNVWKLRLSKKLGVYKDSGSRELTMPVWRVAISDSRDPRNMAVEGDSKVDTLYRKKENSVLHRLNMDFNEFSIFSMQPKQFRNLPTFGTKENVTAYKIDKINDLDLYKVDASDSDKIKYQLKEPEEIPQLMMDWVPYYDFSVSNVLGAGAGRFFETETETGSENNFTKFIDEDSVKDKVFERNTWRRRDIELDRIVWFTTAQGDDDEHNDSGKSLATAGKFPDAVRTFAKKRTGDEKEDNKPVLLEPNQYLVLGPSDKRSVGSVAYNQSGSNNDKRHYGQAPTVYDFDLESLSSQGKKFKYLVITSNIGNVGLNISEPLWLGDKLDPYYSLEDNKNKNYISNSLVGDEVSNKKAWGIRDIPFEMPEQSGRNKDFYESFVQNYPIVQDGLFGIGTVPAYKSAFLQRVADPNRPYHPLMNPYISVDWNTMDLTVFTGESEEIGGVLTDAENGFFAESETNSMLHLDKDELLGFNVDDSTLNLEDAFSSRQWGSSNQEMLSPTLDSSADSATESSNSFARPNPWARAFKKADKNGGLEKGTERQTTSKMALKYAPKHTLGAYNDRGVAGDWGTNGFVANPSSLHYRNINSDYSVGSIYYGTPRIPFEHLVWNDAPFSNIMELTLVPASSNSRFGLEFVRSKDATTMKFQDQYDRENGSLGSSGLFGFGDWPGAKGGVRKRAGKLSPYFNFWSSNEDDSDKVRSLDLCNLLDFVSTPSRYLGTRRLAGSDNRLTQKDDNNNFFYYPITDNDWLLSQSGTSTSTDPHSDNPLFYPSHREPGKININTVTDTAWQALEPNASRMVNSDANLDFRQPVAQWTEEVKPRFDLGLYFQPSHTTKLWAQMGRTNVPTPTSVSLLTHSDAYTYDLNSGYAPLFDNMGKFDEADKYEVDPDSGEILFVSDENDPTSGAPLPEVKRSELASLSDEIRATYYPKASSVNEYRRNLYDATAEIQRLSGLTTNRSNTFAVWVTVGYFEVERCNPGVNMPNVDPKGGNLKIEQLTDNTYPWYQYYQAIYPDGYTYGKELGSEYGETKRHRGFAIIDRSVPVDFRRGSSVNYKKSVLLQRVLD